MNKPRPSESRPEQQTTEELLSRLEAFVRRQFYPDDFVQFAKDRRHLRRWVLLYPARWLIGRGVTISLDQYHKLVVDVLTEALRHGKTGEIDYRPAWLGKVIQTHINHHGEELYNQAKSARELAANTMAMLGKAPVAGQVDPLRTLAAASRLLEAKKRPQKVDRKEQLSLL